KKQSEAVGFQPVEVKMEEGEMQSSSSEEEETYTHKEASSTTTTKEELGEESLNNSASADPLDNLDLPAIADLFEMCKSMCGQRNLSVLLYSLMRHVGVTWRDADDLFTNIGALRCQASHKWLKVFLSGYTEAFTEEGRGGKHSDSFYDIFPEIECEARAYTVEG
ncbi:unnamed protein product, partial [Didymodactylos carnosus]